MLSGVEQPPGAGSCAARCPTNQVGTIVGTRHYVAPELLFGETDDARTDVQLQQHVGVAEPGL